MNTTSGKSIAEKTILAKAFFNASEKLNLTQTQLATILSTSESTIVRLRTQLQINPTSKEGKIAILIIQLFKSLHDLSGGDLDWIRLFLNSNNQVTGGVPIKQIETAHGLNSVVQFVKAIQH